MSEDVLALEKQPEVRELIERELREDIGPGDATTLALVDAEATAAARVVARQELVLAGVHVAAQVFRMADDRLTAESLAADGSEIRAGEAVLRVEGPARAILSAERTALNLLQRMSGIATATDCLVRIVNDYGTQILDTRKTVPGLRKLDKHAVACGGGTNHRAGLHDAILIKDNHLAFWRQKNKGSLADAVAAARAAQPGLKIEIEVDTLEQLKEALPGKPDWVLLDNMPPETVAEAVALCAGLCRTEASGGITKENVREYARAGVTAISIGALTHSVRAADLGLDFE
ncbi:MAG TPA: carboxylating nicotinate-nucleotide diphosphorylase [Kiritimatiellia bacterium]|nr:carboxylating nicotinate-nucleotide diphosphorylase [Kiritimatiellia bacterium]HPR68486.1 carboxylating nicotinate-nucleotide diphosphorylase [Kiritimatiellia bacterium]HRX06432.1 carboxylating nicotinate-nucleotide diphosphorylase [Kiritimatiellia bacterium]